MVGRKSFLLLLICGTLLVAHGCSNDDADNRQMVSGSVNLDGEPLATGSITFFPETEGTVATGGQIKNGEFVIPKEQGLPVGIYKVSIISTVSSAPASADPNELMENPPQVKSLIPKNYNSETTLKAEIDDSSENSLSFDLTSN